jgi:hypothetical protein
MQTKDLDRLAAIEQISNYALSSNHESIDTSKFKTYNEYVAHKINTMPDIMLAFLQYEGGADAIYYMQLVWMEDWFRYGKKTVS